MCFTLIITNVISCKSLRKQINVRLRFWKKHHKFRLIIQRPLASVTSFKGVLCVVREVRLGFFSEDPVEWEDWTLSLRSSDLLST